MRQTWWARGQLADASFETGKWDEALEHADAVIAYVEAGTPQYFESGCRLVRAAVNIARGHAFADDIARAIEHASEATDPQARDAARRPRLVPPVHGRKHRGGTATAGLRARNRTRLRGRRGIHPLRRGRAAALLELDPAALTIPPVDNLDTRRDKRATAALLDGDLLGATEALAELGKAADEAYLRLRLGETLLSEGRTDEGVAQIERALDFYRGVRATRFIAEAESLLADVEQQTA